MTKSSTTLDVIRILVVDDHPAMREGLGIWISRQPDMEMVGEAADANTAMKLIEATRPDVVVVDLSLKESDGVDLIRRIVALDLSIHILVCSMHPEIPYAMRTLKLGARGYIGKQCGGEEITDAIRKVAQGDYFTSKAVSEQLLKEVLKPRKADNGSGLQVSILSDRELQVFEHIGRGLTMREITDRLHLSSNTIETYRQRIKMKLNIHSNADLSSKAVQWVLENQGH